MEFVINDFEFVQEPQAQSTNGAGRQGAQSQQDSGSTHSTNPAATRVEDIERIARHFRERQARLVAD